MRLSPLFLSVLLFVTATDFAAADHHPAGSSGGAADSPATQQTDRQLNRQMRRAQRADQLDALRTRFGQGARSGDAAASEAQNRLSSVVTILPVGDPGTGATDIPESPDTDPPQYLGPPIAIDNGSSFWEGFPDDGAMPADDTGDKPHHGSPFPVIYTLNGESGPQFRGNHHSGPGSADAPPFAPLEQLRGMATDTPAAGHVPDALPSAQATARMEGHFDLSRADRLLAKRLADIDHMRDIALRNGNTKLLDKADKLEQLARWQFGRRPGLPTNPEAPQAPVPDPDPGQPSDMAPPPDQIPDYIEPALDPDFPRSEQPGTATTP